MDSSRGFTSPIIYIDELAYFRLIKVKYKLRNKSKHKFIKIYKYVKKTFRNI